MRPGRLRRSHAMERQSRNPKKLGQLRIVRAVVLPDTQVHISGDIHARFDAVAALVDFEFD